MERFFTLGDAKREKRTPQKTENPSPVSVKGLRCGWAANYFPTVSRSIIVAAVRPRAIAATWLSIGLYGWGEDRHTDDSTPERKLSGH